MMSWRHIFAQIASRRGRSLLTLFSVVIAVTAIVAVASATATTRKAYRQVFEALAGGADLEVNARGGDLFQQDVVDRLRSLPGVRDIVPVFRRATIIYGAGKKAKALAIGIVPGDKESTRGYEIAAGRLPTEDDELALDASLAAAIHVQVGDDVKLLLSGGLRTRKLVGAIRIASTTQMHEGGMAIAPLASLQKASRAPGQVNALHVYLDNPGRAAEVIAQGKKLLPETLEIERPSSRNGLAEQTLQLTDISLYLASALSFTTAVFIALSVFLMSVSERRRHFSIMRAIGATRGQVMRMVCVEAISLGLVGAVVGVPLGVLAGSIVTDSMATVLQVKLPAASLSPGAIALGALMGPLVCLAGAWYPARAAGQVSPLEGMRPAVAMDPRPSHRSTTWAGLAGVALTCALMAAALAGAAPSWVAVVAVVVALVSLVLFLPAILAPAVNLLARPLERLLAFEGEISRRLVLRRPGRSSLTIGVLFMAVAAGTALGNAVFSVDNDIRSWHRRTMMADFFVRTLMPDLSGQDPTSMPDTMGAEIAALPGTSKVEAIKVLRVDVDGQPALLAARDFEVYDQPPLDLVQGDPRQVVDALRKGEAVVGAVLAEKARLRVGQTIEVTAGDAQHKLRVAGVTNEYLSGGSIVYVERSVAEKQFDFHGVDSFLVQAKSGQREALREALGRLAEQHGVMMQTFADLAQRLDANTASVTGGLWALLALGLLVGALGVVNTLTMNIAEQTRELGMLRAIGVARYRIVKTVMGQAVLIGLLGITSGALAGLILSRSINFCLGAMFGHPVEFALRPSFAALLWGVALLVVLLASFAPARRAGNVNPILAMRQD